MAILLEQLSKHYGAHRVVDNVSLEIATGELLVLLGASGSGKSTILRLIAGLTQPSHGRILLHGRDVTNLPPQQRGTGFVFQNYSIFRHMSVSANVEFGLKVRKVPKSDRESRCDELLELVGLSGLGNRYAHQLSGGQQQRVALARALAYEPSVLLLDEPFGALDVKTRTHLRRTLKAIQERLGITTILVTHDQEEALDLADRVGIVEHGHLLEIDRPEILYARPKSLSAATFLGAGTVLVGRTLEGQAQFGDLSLSIPSDSPHQEGSRALALFRPEHIVLSTEKPNGMIPLLGRGEIIERNFAGPLHRLRLRLPRLSLTRQIAPPLPFGEEGLLVEAILPAESSLESTELWVGVRDWHILSQPHPRLLLYDAGAGSETTLEIGRYLMERLDASATILGVTSDPEAQEAVNPSGNGSRKEVELSNAVRCLRYGQPAEQIACEYSETLYEMVVVAAGAPYGTQWDRLGATVKAVLEMTEAAVLVVKREKHSFERILIGTTAGSSGKSNVRVGGRLARRLGVEVTLLHVSCESMDPGHSVLGHLQRASATLRAMDVQNEVRVRQARTTVEGIMEEADEGKYDLIVVGSHGPRSRPPFALDDVTLQILARTPQSVLVVPTEEV